MGGVNLKVYEYIPCDIQTETRAIHLESLKRYEMKNLL